MKYLAVLGRQPEISIAELEAVTSATCGLVFSTGPAAAAYPQNFAHANILGVPPAASPVDVKPSTACASFDYDSELDIDRLGGCIKLAIKLEQSPLEYLSGLTEGKLTIGVSDYSVKASRKTAVMEALKLKKILVRHGRSVRVVENKEAVLSTATSLHNGLSGRNPRKVELIKLNDEWYRVIGVQDIDAYAKRDQARPARDARVGMLPPKLAQVLINLCGPLESGSVILDPFCGTGVVLQEALLMGYRAYGTDLSEKMVDYTNSNLKWLFSSRSRSRLSLQGSLEQAPRWSPRSENSHFQIAVGDATSFQWTQPIAAVACEGYLGKPFSQVPSEMELKAQKQECGAIVAGFLKNLVGQIKAGTPVVIAVPAWLRSDGSYERMNILDEISDMGYNVNNKSREGLLYHRDGQVVARDILILRKK